jgi:hypothetical protein
MIGVQRQVNNLFAGVNKIKEFQECRASLGLPDSTSAEVQALSSLNEIFVTYKAIHMVEEDRLDQLLDRAHQYHNSVVFAIEEARRRSLRLDATLERVEDYNLCNKRSPAAMLNKGQLAALDREMMALTDELDDSLPRKRKKSRKTKKRTKGLAKKLGASRKSTEQDFEASVEYHGNGPKLGYFPVAK